MAACAVVVDLQYSTHDEKSMRPDTHPAHAPARPFVNARCVCLRAEVAGPVTRHRADRPTACPLRPHATQRLLSLPLPPCEAITSGS